MAINSLIFIILYNRLSRRVRLLAQELKPFPEHLSLLPVAQSSVFYVVSCGSLFVLLSFFYRLLCYLSFFNLRILINSSHNRLSSESDTSIQIFRLQEFIFKYIMCHDIQVHNMSWTFLSAMYSSFSTHTTIITIALFDDSNQGQIVDF